MTLSSVAKGTIGVAHCITYLVEQGFTVSVPINDNQPYDLLYDDGEVIRRVSVKFTSQRNRTDTAYVVELKSVRPNRTQNNIHRFDKTVVDALFVYCADGSRYFFLMDNLNVGSALALTAKQNAFMVL